MAAYYLAVDIGASSGRHILGHMENGKMVLEEIYRRNKYLYNLIKSSFPIIVLLFEQQRRTCHTAVRRLYLY